MYRFQRQSDDLWSSKSQTQCLGVNNSIDIKQKIFHIEGDILVELSESASKGEKNAIQLVNEHSILKLLSLSFSISTAISLQNISQF